MVAILGTYENGRVTFEEDVNVPNKGKVIVTFLEEEEPEIRKVLKLSNFSFAKTRELLKERGQPMLVDAQKKFDEGLIDERTYNIMKMGAKMADRDAMVKHD